MAANMRSPKPADPLSWRLEHVLTVRCLGCRNAASGTVRAWVVWNRLDDRITFWDMQRRMVCLRCRRRETAIDLHE